MMLVRASMKLKSKLPSLEEQKEIDAKKAAFQARRQRRKMQYNPMTSSLVRMAFNRMPPSLKDLYFEDEL
jgi:hypothetical protein